MKYSTLAVGLGLWLASGIGQTFAAPIHDAAESGDTAKLQELVSAGTPVNETRSGDEATALHVAVFAGNLAAAELLIKDGADVNAHTKAGYTPLHLAALKGYSQIVELLITHGAEIDPVAVDGTTPLHLAAMSGNEPAIKQLLDAGADRSIRDFQGRTPYDVATYRARTDIAELIMPNQSVTPSIYRDGTATIERRIQQMDATIKRYRNAAAAADKADSAAAASSDQGGGQAAAPAEQAPATTEELLRAANDLIGQSREPASAAPSGIDATIADEKATGDLADLSDTPAPDLSAADDSTVADARAFLQGQGQDGAAAPSASAGGDYAVQLTAVRSEEAAEREWSRLKDAHSDLLVALDKDITSVDLGDRGTFYRLRTGPLAKSRATAICDSLTASNENCLVVKR